MNLQRLLKQQHSIQRVWQIHNSDPLKVIALIKKTKQVLYKNCQIRKAMKYVRSVLVFLEGKVIIGRLSKAHSSRQHGHSGQRRSVKQN